MRRVVVGIAGPQDDAALDIAVDEALRRRLPLEVIHAFELPTYGDEAPLLLPRTGSTRADAEQCARDAVDRVLRRQSAASTLDLSVHVTEGTAAAPLIAAAQGAAIVVVGRRGGGPLVRAVRGSVSAAVLHGSWAPVMLVPPGTVRVADRSTASQVVVGLDGSPASHAALAWAVAQAVEWGSVLVPVVVVSSTGAAPEGLRPAAGAATHGLVADVWRRVREAGAQALEVHPVFRHGSAVHELVGVPGRNDLLVVGSRGRGPAQTLLLGSTSTRVAETCAAPVVIVREGQARREIQRRVLALSGGPR